MPELFLIYAIDGGWVTLSGTMSSDWTKAAAFDWEEARKRCLRQRDHEGNFTWIPVSRDHIRDMVNYD